MADENKARDVTLGLFISGARAGARAGRVVVLPVRVAARTPLLGSVLRRTGGELEREGQEAQERARQRLESGAEEALDQVFAGPLPEAAVRSAAEHQLAQRIAAEIVARPEFEQAFAAALEHKMTERLLTEAIDSRLAEELTDRVVQSPEFQRTVEQVAASPGVRAAMTRQSASLAEELVGGVRSSAESADDRLVLGKARRVEAAEPGAYAGIATRGIGFAFDLLLTHLIFLVGAGLANLAVALVGELRPQWLAATLLACWWTIVTATYFVVCWTAAGQTPGMRLMRLRVLRPDGRPPTVLRSIVRLFGLLLAIIPFFLGFAPMLFDSRRRGLQDYLAGTAVVHAEREHLAVAPELGRAAPTLSS
jgi:uncharacterized RDD family membrane protein YckC